LSRNRLGAGLMIIVLGAATMAMPLSRMLAEDRHNHSVESIDK
jgi:hypothetical protein